MYNHAPKNYICPFCLLLNGTENENVQSVSSDIFYRGEVVSAFISSRQWTYNHGHALVVPNQHYENIYDLPVDLGGEIYRLVQTISLAMKIQYGCDGISTRQHNEPAGNQDVWHYHVHVFPRYTDDHLYISKYAEMAAVERAKYAKKLRDYFQRSGNAS